MQPVSYEASINLLKETLIEELTEESPSLDDKIEHIVEAIILRFEHHMNSSAKAKSDFLEINEIGEDWDEKILNPLKEAAREILTKNGLLSSDRSMGVN